MKTMLLPFACVGLLAVSCSPKYYSPNTQNVPLIRERGEVGITLAGSSNQVEFQGAYGLTNSIAIQANGGWFIPGDLDNGNGGSGSFGEGGVGFYRPLGESFVFETYGLFGFGKVENHMPSTTEQYPETTGKITARVARYGIQPNFGWRTKYVTIAISSRFVILDYSNINGSLIFENEDQVDYLRNNRTSLLFEPALTVRGGLEKVKFQVQIGPSINVTNSSFRQDDGYATLGLAFNLR
jgi:hypothetical protein